MPKQPTFPALGDTMKMNVTRRKQFLAKMDSVVFWGRFLALIAPHYPKGGRPPMPLETMLRVYFLQNWYELSDPMAEETLYDSNAMCRFDEIKLGDDRIADETTTLKFRHLLERHDLTEAIFADVNVHLADKAITLRSGTIVDATIIDAPSSTKNKAKARDPEMSSPNKVNGWHIGSEEDQQTFRGAVCATNAHIGVDVDSGVAVSLDTLIVKLHNSEVRDELLHGEEMSVWADKGYARAEREEAFKGGPGKFWSVMCKAPKGGPLLPLDERPNGPIATIRAKVEHPFRIIKRQFCHLNARHRSLAKTRALRLTLFALANLYLLRRRLMA